MSDTRTPVDNPSSPATQASPVEASVSGTRRRLLQASGALAATVGAPGLLLAQPAPIKVGVLLPLTGAVAFPGQQSREGVLLALEDINGRGGIKSLGGAKLDPVIADAQSQPQVGAAEVDKLAEAGVCAIVGPYASAVAFATTQAAARHNLACVLDQAVADQITARGLKNVFRFGPSYEMAVRTGINNFHILNTVAGKPVKSVVVVHEESLFGTGTANTIARDLPALGYEVLEVIKHANPTRDFNNIALRIKSRNPDVVMQANYLNEFALLLRTMRQQGVRPKAMYSIFGGGGSNPKVAKDLGDAAEYVLDCNHWFNPRDKRGPALRARAEKKGLAFTHELLMGYNAMMLLADSIERAKSVKREAIIEALASSTWADHFMPYGPTRFVNGQNQGAQPIVTQILKGDVRVVLPNTYAETEPVFPAPRA
jgi:branched-chain amino acid transport system substrate-binding protein